MGCRAEGSGLKVSFEGLGSLSLSLALSAETLYSNSYTGLCK